MPIRGGAAHERRIARPEFARPAKIACYLVESAEPERLTRMVMTRARRYVRAKDLTVIVGHVEEQYPVLYRVLPSPDRLGA